MHPVPVLAYLSLAASMALVGAYVGLSRLLVAVFPLFLLAWLRFIVGGLAMLHWLRRPADEAPLQAGQQAVESSIAGNLWQLQVRVGQPVKAGDTVAVLESMKMEIALQERRHAA